MGYLIHQPPPREQPAIGSRAGISMQVVWFKRDLRVFDHAPLRAAAQAGPVLCLYGCEPEAWRQPEADARHLAFLADCLDALRAALEVRGVRLCVIHADMPDALARIERTVGPIDAVHAHEETGLAWSYARDDRVRAWLVERGAPLHEWPNNGVVRRLSTRDRWSKEWQRRMTPEPLDGPSTLVDAAVPELVDGLPSARELGVPEATHRSLQRGGEDEAFRLLDDFLDTRGVDYRRAMSSPVTAFDACSRISPHLALGCLSIRQIHHRVERARPAGSTL